MRPLSVSFALAALVLSCVGCAVAAQFPVLDESGKAVIVYQRDAKGEGEQAYRDLAAYLKRSTGQDFTVISERDFDPATSAGKPIYVGTVKALPFEDRRQLRSLDRDAYIVNVTADAVYLAGPRPWSTYWAVCQFLEDYAGVRWLIPGPLGEDVPEHESVVVPCGRQVYEPAILSRLWSGANHGGVWSLRQRIHGRYNFHHNLLNIFKPGDYEDHPEWFPLHGDTRYKPAMEDNSWQPCFASESSVKHGADTARAAFAANPDLESYSYGCNDGQGWCECDGCTATDREAPEWEGFDGSMSYRYYTWLNKVAAELETTHPDAMLGCLAYSTYIIPPEQIGLHKNIIPYLTSNRADYYEPEFREKDQALLEWWGRVANQMGIYDYAYGMGFAIPRIYNHLFQEAIQHAVDNNVKGFYAEVYPNWGLDGHKLYVMSRVLWNPDVDIDAITDEWNERMFREAAEPMKAYFARCERAWREQNTGRGEWAYRLAADPKQFEVFPPEVLEECTGYLDEAAGMAESQLVKDRIGFFRKTWDITLLLAGQAWAARDVQTLIEQGATLDEVAAAMRGMAEKISSVDVDAFIKEKVGDDPIAYYPPKPSWISPLKAGAATNAKRWSAARLASDAVAEARKTGDLNAAGLRDAIAARIDTHFGTTGSDTYMAAVAEIKSSATRVATVARADTPPAVDGRIDDAAWKGADEISDFTRYAESAPSTYVTKAWMVHDGKDLYVALACYQDTSELKVDAAPRDGSTWHDDSIEFFINPDMAEFPYIQFIINAKGAFFDQHGQNDMQSYQERLAADFDADWAANVEKDRWTAEMRIPMDQIGCSIEGHPLLRVDLIRNVMSGPDEEISAWFPSIGAHADPLSRGWIVFE